MSLLEFFASPEKQCAFQAEVCRSEGYAYNEFASWWADDFHPSSNLFLSAFTVEEISILHDFNTVFERALAQIGGSVPNVAQLLSKAEWQRVVGAAGQAYVALKP